MPSTFPFNVRLPWLAGILLFGSLCLSALHGGEVARLDDHPDVHGKLTLNASSIHVDGNSASEVNLGDILEADFNDDGFHLDYFSSLESPAQLPSNWQGHDMGHTDTPGSFTYTNGTVKIIAAATKGQTGDSTVGTSDRGYFLGQAWTGDDGQWTARLKSRSVEVYRVGMMVRASLDPASPTFQFSAERDTGIRSARYTAGTVPSYDARFNAPVPGWIRLTRRHGSFMSIETSNDGMSWDMVEQLDMRHDGVNPLTSAVAGIFVTGKSAKVPGSAEFDNITFAPGPTEAEMLPQGVLLKSGSFLAGGFDGLDAKTGSFNRKGKFITITPDQVDAVLWQPTRPRQLLGTSAPTGLIMESGDFLAADFLSLNSAGARMNSVLFGTVDYGSDATKACILRPVQPQPAPYEIRLKDGSQIRTNSVEIDKGQLLIHEVSGIIVTADPREVAQFRAGTAIVQSLMELPWKVTRKTDASSSPKLLPSIAPTDDPASLVPCWQGNNQEQIMAAAPGTIIAFALPEKYRAIAMHIAVLSTTPKAQATLSVLANGRPVGPPMQIKAGDAPRYLQISLEDTQSISFVADSPSPDAKLLYVDPVAILKK